MRYPKFLLLDVFKPRLNFTTYHWTLNYLFALSSTLISPYSIIFHQKFLNNKWASILNFYTNDQFKVNFYISTQSLNFYYSNLLADDETYTYFIDLYKIRLKVKNKLLFSKHFSKTIQKLFGSSNSIFDLTNLKYLLTTLGDSKYFKTNIFKTMFDLNFLRKEKIYTKLKYSRVPQYDIVSGGSAALFAAFLGFLFCEKFGFELVDSGDFYFICMYVVFLCFIVRLYLKLINNTGNDWLFFSLKWFYTYITVIIGFIFNYFNQSIK